MLCTILTRTLKTISRSAKLNYPAASRNAGPILEVAGKILDAATPGLQLLEISSGSGQHSAVLSQHFPNISFQPTEYDESLLPSIAAYAAENPHGNMKTPCCVDIREDVTFADRPEGFDYMLNVNMIHISPWQCTVGLFRSASRLLKPGGLLITYGPYAVNGELTPESNQNFDRSLRRQNSEWGVRDVRDLKVVAEEYGIRFREMFDMPANNKTIVWEKR